MSHSDALRCKINGACTNTTSVPACGSARQCPCHSYDGACPAFWGNCRPTQTRLLGRRTLKWMHSSPHLSSLTRQASGSLHSVVTSKVKPSSHQHKASHGRLGPTTTQQHFSKKTVQIIIYDRILHKHTPAQHQACYTCHPMLCAHGQESEVHLCGAVNTTQWVGGVALKWKDSLQCHSWTMAAGSCYAL